MPELSITYFQLLKEEVESTYKHSFTDCSKKINDWSGREILNLQNDLHEKVKGHISEKWFYTHIKPLNNEKLPRIDILDLLSQYSGYEDWNDFVRENKDKAKDYFLKYDKDASKKSKSGKRNFIPFSIALLALAIIIVPMIMVIIGTRRINRSKAMKENYVFCFVDADLGKPILNNDIEITILNKYESPITTQCDEDCFEFDSEQEVITFIVSARYYKIDTISRILNKKERQEIIKLKTDDYALMIHLFSKSGIEGWEKRREQLDGMLSDNAQIFQIDENNIGMELYNKSEFIDKLTTPLKSLKNIEILETQYKNNLITEIRFVQLYK